MAQQPVRPSPANTPPRMTYEEFLEWATEHRHAEWFDGEVTVLPATTVRHDSVVRFLVELLHLLLHRRGSGRVYEHALMALEAERRVRRPDVAITLPTNSIETSENRLDGPADLVIEVVAEETVARDRRDKWSDYARAGVVEYWIVDGRTDQARVEPYALNDDGFYEPIRPDADGLFSSDVVPGFVLDPAWLKADSLPEPVRAIEQIDGYPQRPPRGLPAEARRELVRERAANARKPRTSNPSNPPRWEEGMEPGQFPMTYVEYLSWSGDCMRCEWVDGMAFVRPFPGFRHGEVRVLFGFALSHIVEVYELGQVYPLGLEMLVLDHRTSRFPDIQFIARDHLNRLDDQGLKGPADLVAEVVNDESLERDRVEKFAEYAAAGVREYWIVDARAGCAGIDAFALSEAGRYQPIAPDAEGCLHSIVVPGFWFDPAWLNEEPLPFYLDVAFRIAPEAMRRHIELVLATSPEET